MNASDNPASASQPQRPNIIVVMADDLETGLTERLLQNGFMPNLKKHIIEQGITFKNSFVTTSLCCPTRATFLTGQYSHNHHVLSNELPDGSVTQLKDSNTLVTWLKETGYKTCFVGKYLNKYGSDPTALSTSPLSPIYIPPGWDDWHALIKRKMYNYSINSNGTYTKYGSAPSEYQTDKLASISAQIIQRTESNDEQPFFLWIAPHAPHIESNYKNQETSCEQTKWSASVPPAPRHQGVLSSWKLPKPPSFNEQDISDKPFSLADQPLMTETDIRCAEQQYRDRAESMLAVDDLIGTVVQALIDDNEWDNTVFIFTSDNGYYNGEHRLFGKVLQYEEGIRVPLYIRIPGIKSEPTNQRFALSNDLAPTIAELAGASPNLKMDGRSLLPIIQNPELKNWRKRFLLEFYGSMPAKYADLEFWGKKPSESLSSIKDNSTFQGIRTDFTDPVAPNQMLNIYSDGSKEHYDLSADPYQLENKLHHSPPTLQSKTLEEYLNKLKNCGGGNCHVYED